MTNVLTYRHNKAKFELVLKAIHHVNTNSGEEKLSWILVSAFSEKEVPAPFVDQAHFIRIIVPAGLSHVWQEQAGRLSLEPLQLEGREYARVAYRRKPRGKTTAWLKRINARRKERGEAELKLTPDELRGPKHREPGEIALKLSSSSNKNPFLLMGQLIFEFDGYFINNYGLGVQSDSGFPAQGVPLFDFS